MGTLADLLGKAPLDRDELVALAAGLAAELDRQLRAGEPPRVGPHHLLVERDGSGPFAVTPRGPVPKALGGPRSDVIQAFELGSVLFRAATGQVPFKSRAGLEGDLQTATGGWPAELARELRALVLDLLSQDTAARPSLADAAGRLANIAEQGGNPVVAATLAPRQVDPDLDEATVVDASPEEVRAPQAVPLRSKPASVAPPARSKPASVAPPARSKPASVAPPARSKPASVAPPVRSKPASLPPPVRAKGATLPPPIRSKSASLPAPFGRPVPSARPAIEADTTIEDIDEVTGIDLIDTGAGNDVAGDSDGPAPSTAAAPAEPAELVDSVPVDMGGDDDLRPPTLWATAAAALKENPRLKWAAMAGGGLMVILLLFLVLRSDDSTKDEPEAAANPTDIQVASAAPVADTQPVAEADTELEPVADTEPETEPETETESEPETETETETETESEPDPVADTETESATEPDVDAEAAAERRAERRRARSDRQARQSTTRARDPETVAQAEPDPPKSNAPSSAAEWLAQAKSYRAKGNARQAYAAYNKAAAGGGKVGAEAELGAAQMAYAMKNYSLSIKRGRKAVNRGANKRKSWLIVAHSYCKMGQERAAWTAFAQVGGGTCK